MQMAESDHLDSDQKHAGGFLQYTKCRPGGKEALVAVGPGLQGVAKNEYPNL